MPIANPNTTAAGFQPGDIVKVNTRDARAPRSLTNDHLYVIVGDGQERSEDRILTMTHAHQNGGVGSERGWGADDSRTPADLRETLRGTSMWFFRSEHLTKVPDAEADLPQDMEEKRRLIQTAALGAEPVLLCTQTSHVTSAQPHRHAHRGDDATERGTYARRPSTISDYTPEPGLWTNDSSLVTVSQGCDTSTETVAEARDLHPINYRNMEGIHSVILTSREGALSGDSVVFGCQTIPLNVIQRQGGTLQFTPSGGVIVTSKGAVDLGREGINVGDRVLGFRDINEYTTSIVVDTTTPPDPDAEVKAAIYEVIRGSVESARRTRSETILADLRAAGFDVVKRDA